MNVEELREYCLSMDESVEEKFPFAKFKSGENVLVFYICGHMFCFLDIAEFDLVVLKCQPEHIEPLKAAYDFVGPPSHENAKYWIGLHIRETPDELARELITNSFALVKEKYEKKRKRKGKNEEGRMK